MRDKITARQLKEIKFKERVLKREFDASAKVFLNILRADGMSEEAMKVYAMGIIDLAKQLSVARRTLKNFKKEN